MTPEVVERGLVPAPYAVTLDADTGAISGANGLPGVLTGSVQVTDAISQQATAAFELDLKLAFHYTTEDLVTTEATNSYPDWAEPGPYFIVPGDRVQVSGVDDPGTLRVGFLGDLLFTLTSVDSSGTPTPEEIVSFDIDTNQGAVSQVNEVAARTPWH